MSHLLGSDLPAKLVTELCKERPSPSAVPLVSLDPDGYPHVALISYFELAYLEKRLFFFLGASSRSSRYLSGRTLCTLVFVDQAFVYYVKCRAQYLGESSSQAVFQGRVISVLEDLPSSRESNAVLESGIRFSEEVDDGDRRLRLRARVLESVAGL